MKNENNIEENNLSITVIIDEQVKRLSKMQVDLMCIGMVADDFNEISEMIGQLKEFMINNTSYDRK